MENFSEDTQKLISKYQEIFKSESKALLPEGSVIHVDEIASKLASLYEKVRGIIDWKEEHLIRRTAIERALKRRLISELSGFGLAAEPSPKIITEPLVLELIRGGHFSNDKILTGKLDDVKKVLHKYISILTNNPISRKNSNSGLKKRLNLYNWILEIAACEIEETLDPPLKEYALIEYMTNLMLERIKVYPDNLLSEEERKILVYIAVHRTLFRLDSPIISYRLIKYRYPFWTNPSEESLQKIAQNILSIWETTESYLNHPLTNKFYRVCEEYDTLYLILSDILKEFSKNPAEISIRLSESNFLDSLVGKYYNIRLSTLKSRLFRMAIYSTLSVFVAGGFSLFIVEVPIAKFFYGKFNLLAILVDLVLPTILMFILVSLVKLPGKDNLEKVKGGIKKIVYGQEKIDFYEIRADKKRGILTTLVITLVYLLGSALSLGFVFWIFYIAKIPITSVYIDTLNVAVIVFAALIIRQRAKELVVEEKTNLWDLFIDTLSVPVARIGQWLANKWKEYNIVSVFFTVLVDTPFQTFVELIESWSSFIKEKKAGIR